MTTTNKREMEQLLNDYMAIWNEREYSKIPDNISESFERVSPVAEEDVQGHDGLEAFIRGLEASFSDFQITTDDYLIGEETVMIEGTFTGTHDGHFNEIPPTNRKVAFGHMSVIRIENGAIQGHRTYYDPRDIMDQLGATDE